MDNIRMTDRPAFARKTPYRYIALFLALITVTLSACTGKPETDTTKETGTTTQLVTQTTKTETVSRKGATSTDIETATTAAQNVTVTAGTDAPTSANGAAGTTAEASGSTAASSASGKDAAKTTRTQGKTVSTDAHGTTTPQNGMPTEKNVTTGTESSVEYFSNYKDTRLAKFLKKYDMDNVYLKVRTLKDGKEAVREFGSKDGNVYSSVEDADNKLIYLSNGRITYLLDTDEKTYTVYSLMPLALSFEYDGCIGAGDGVFDGRYCIYEAFYNPEDGNIICHLFDEDGNWLGYENYNGTTIVQTNYIVSISSFVPSHLFFTVPADYKYYYVDTPITWPSDWD